MKEPSSELVGATTKTADGVEIQGYNLPGQFYLQGGRRGKGAKCNCAQVVEMRAKHQAGATYPELGALYSISWQAAAAICQHRTYTDCKKQIKNKST
ncbi:MAG: hypothetical protein PF440_07530 [Thiomicrorhabdus sp.]|nr:hypothetical protein [Thiomicrorhabdus sp.]